MTTPRKKLIEVALPLDRINLNAGKEKDVHVGVLSNMHTWWSRKPLGVARAVLFASIVDDPGEDQDRRQHLFELITKLSDHALIHDKTTLDLAKKEIGKSLNDSAAVFWDPFSGGGSLPLEAMRLGLRPHATDINPVAALLNKVVCELAPRYIQAAPIHARSRNDIRSQSAFGALISDVENFAEDIKQALEPKLGRLYERVRLPPEFGGKEVTPLAWIWARTVRCPNPACKSTTPLANKFWLSTHVGNEAWVDPTIDPSTGKLKFVVHRGKGTPRSGTVNKTGAKCIACDQQVPFAHIRSEGQEGNVGYTLMAVVADYQRRRIYLDPPHPRNVEMTPAWSPTTTLPEHALGFRVQKYGITHHAQLFTARQLTIISAFSDEVRRAVDKIRAAPGADTEYCALVASFLAFGVSRLAQTNNTLVRWFLRKGGTSKGTPTFDRQVVSMVWEFSEGCVFGNSVGSWAGAIKNPLLSLDCLPRAALGGSAGIYDVSNAKDGSLSSVIVSTDPPYFDNIGYADLSDIYYIWLRQCLRDVFPDLFSTVLTPKSGNLTSSDEVNHGSFEPTEFSQKLSSAFRSIRTAAREDVPVTVYYAFKQSEAEEDEGDGASGFASTGWEALLQSLVQVGFSVTGTWPLRTERAARGRAIGSNALASSIVLVCRKRPSNAPVTTRAEFLKVLKRELPAAVALLKQSNIAPVDLAQAAIGPGMAIFTRHARVLEADDRPMTVKTALQLINAALDEALSEQEADYDAETRFAVTWFETHAMASAPFGEAETLAKARNVSVAGIKEAGIVNAGGGKVQLKPRADLPADWNALTDARATVWECTQHLIRLLEDNGEGSAAELLASLSSRAEPARDLAYRLYQICERKKWADEARAYNGLVVAWPELVKLAAKAAPDVSTQGALIYGDDDGDH